MNNGITELRLTNFRRHADTELHFSGDAQIILIAGRNGVGKSTLLESIHYGLWGEGRYGKRQLAKLVRRGAELEGMQVDMTFVVGDVTYQVVRRYERGKSSAQLYANGTLVFQSPGGVTAEISRILGMDAVGFKLAVIAQQKELDGLASLTESKRQETMGRLLRLDAIKKAAEAARRIYNRELDVARALGSGPDLDALTAELAEQRTGLEQARAALVDARDVVVQIDAELAASAAIEATWHAAQIRVAEARATATSAQAERDRIAAELADVYIPAAVPAPAQSLEEIQAALIAVETEIARGEQARTIAETAAATRRELDTVTARLAAVAESLGADTPEQLARDAAEVDGEIVAAEAALAALDERRNDLLKELSTAQARIQALTERESRAATLGDICDACEQPISDEHKHTQAAARADELAELRAEEQRVLADGTALKDERAAAAGRLAELRGRKEALARRRVVVDGLLTERGELDRRRLAYTAQLDRLEVVEVDLEDIYARKGDLKILEAQAQQAEQTERTRKLAADRRDNLQGKLNEAAGRLAAAQAAQADAAPDADLAAAYTRRQETVTRRAEEAELVGACEAEVRAAEERVAAAERRISDAEGHAETARRHKEAAATAAKTAELLTAVQRRLAREIRPALKGEVAKLLTLLSEGRFTQVEISPKYEITVLDDGKYEPLSEFSGGEKDLIALAVRLALANVVADRHGAGGAGFLILDEVFGSQDDGRREAILSGLRNLNGIYGQIFLISHVGGLNDEADMVLEVTAAGEDRTAEVVAA